MAVAAALATAGAPANAAADNESCVANFATPLAQHNAGAYGEFVSTLAQVYEPNFGAGVKSFAHAPKDACP
jgi:hypothetical protein